MTESVLAISVEVDSTCSVSESWLGSFADRVVPTSCSDGTPVQIFVDRAITSGASDHQLVMLKNNQENSNKGVVSCGEETNSNLNRNNRLSEVSPVFGLDAEHHVMPVQLTVVSACF